MSEPMIGGRLKAARVARGLTLAELADRAGMNMYSVAKIENGKKPNPTWDSVLRLCRVLGITPNELVGDGELGGNADLDDVSSDPDQA